MKNFLFHRVNPKRDKLWDPMDVKLFDKTISYLNNKYNLVVFEDYMQNRITSKKPLASIMFDDGYKDNLEYAAPILEKYNVKASFYIVTNCIDKNEPIWTYTLDNIMQNSKNRTLQLDFDILLTSLKTISLDSEECKKLKPFLKTLSHTERQEILDNIYSQLNDVNVKGLMMNWQEVKQLLDAGHHIGSHTVNHLMLGTIQDKSIVFNELSESKQRIQQKLNIDPLTISYPIGSYNKDTVRIAQQCGYKYGLAVEQKEWINESPFEIPRIELYNEPWLKTRFRSTGGITKLKSLLGR